MALMECTECRKEVSDEAASCPHCGKVINVSAARSGRSVRALIALLVLAGVVAGYYKFFMPSSQKDVVARVAATSSVGVVVVPWVDRAEAALKAQLRTPGQLDVLGNSIVNVTHPTGNNAKVGHHAIRKAGDAVILAVAVDWTGGILGTAYRTSVEWRFTESRHESLEITGDNSLTGVSDSAKQDLEEYFERELYPVVSRNAGAR